MFSEGLSSGLGSVLWSWREVITRSLIILILTGDIMGKGYTDGRSVTSLEMALIHNNEVRRMRIDKLHSLGYEVCRIKGEWFYRKSDTNNKWSKMDK